MKVISRYVSLISVTGLLATGTVIAQTSGSSTSGSGSNSGTQPYNSTNSGTRSTGSGTMSSGSGASGSGSTYNSSDASTRNTGTSTGAGSLSGSTSSSVSGSAFSGMGDALSTSIQSADFNNRSSLTQQIEQQLDTHKDSLKALKKGAKDLEGQARSDFKSAWNDVEDREKELRRSLREARNAEQSNWATVRSDLSQKYQGYMQAVSRAQMQSGSPFTNPSSSQGTGTSGDTTSGTMDRSGSLNSSSGTSGTSGNTGTGSSGSTVPPTTTP